jgi:hypothetical protein
MSLLPFEAAAFHISALAFLAWDKSGNAACELLHVTWVRRAV